jgi:hypothetical protein
MSKKIKNYRLIKGHLSYTYKEISRLFNIHVRTVQGWRKRGLQVIDSNSRPFLVYGEELKRFLTDIRAHRHFKLGSDEFYCTKCHRPRKSKPGQVQYNYTNKIISKHDKLVIIKGICEVCNSSIFLFSTENKLKKPEESGMQFDLFG